MDDHGKVDELRREIALIRGWNDRYLFKKYHSQTQRIANEHRHLRLVEIIRELTMLRKAA